jgi:ribonuclease BN (tRNA processing enzyme)
MRLTVLGTCGAWPEAGQACSGFLVERDGYRLVVDLGYATVPRLFQYAAAEQVDAVFISHGHPDHCADLNPLLRARALRDDPAPPLLVYAPAHALDAVLALDRPGMLDDALDLREFSPGDRLDIGPFDAQTRLLPHWRANAGIRLDAGQVSLAYTGDAGPSAAMAGLADRASLLLAEASYASEVPADSVGNLSSAADAGRLAAQARAGRLLLTHLMRGTSPAAAVAAAAAAGAPAEVARAGMRVDLTGPAPA